MPNSVLTHQDRLLRNAFITEASADHPGDFPAAIRDGVARFRAHRQRLSRGVTETSARPGKRARRIAKAVSESMTAAQAPKPPPAGAPTPAAKAPAAGKLLNELDPDGLAAATADAFSTGRSPFWRPNETAPRAPITETAAAAAAAPPDAPLHTLDADALAARAAAAFAAHGRESGFRSPGWQG